MDALDVSSLQASGGGPPQRPLPANRTAAAPPSCIKIFFLDFFLPTQHDFFTTKKNNRATIGIRPDPSLITGMTRCAAILGHIRTLLITFIGLQKAIENQTWEWLL